MRCFAIIETPFMCQQCSVRRGEERRRSVRERGKKQQSRRRHPASERGREGGLREEEEKVKEARVTAAAAAAAAISNCCSIALPRGPRPPLCGSLSLSLFLSFSPSSEAHMRKTPRGRILPKVSLPLFDVHAANLTNLSLSREHASTWCSSSVPPSWHFLSFLGSD